MTEKDTIKKSSTKTASDRGRSARRRGADFERKIAASLRESGIDVNARRGQQYCGKVEGNADVTTNCGLHIEAKYVARLNLRDAYEQSCHDAKQESEFTGSRKIPVVVHGMARKETLVTLSWEAFLEIYKSYT